MGIAYAVSMRTVITAVLALRLNRHIESAIQYMGTKHGNRAFQLKCHYHLLAPNVLAIHL